MGAKERLQAVQSALESRGVRDVKFFFKLGLAETPKSDVCNGVADFMDAYLNGRFKRVQKIGDAVAV